MPRFHLGQVLEPGCGERVAAHLNESADRRRVHGRDPEDERARDDHHQQNRP
jgi:hypothetical protein